MHEAAGIITYLSPGLRFFHQGQFAGSRKRISPHLVRGPQEPPDGALHEYHARLLAVIRQSIVREGQWRLLECMVSTETSSSRSRPYSRTFSGVNPHSAAA